MNKKISVAIVAKDDPLHLKETINSVLNFADEILIFDIGLKNKTKDFLAKQEKILIKKIEEKVLYVEQIRERLKKYLKNEWLLYLDPDEIFPSTIINKLFKQMDDFDCFSFPRKNIIFNHWVKYSRFWPDYQIRLFKKNAVSWPKEIHSKPVIFGKEYVIEVKEENAILHYNYDDLNQWFEKFLRYAQVEAQYYFENKKNLNLSQTIKKSLSEFFSRYFAGQGYKDGLIGATLSILQMFYYFVVYFYFLQLNNFKIKNEDKKIPLLMQKFFKWGFFESNYWLTKENLSSPLKNFKNKIINKLLKIIS